MIGQHLQTTSLLTETDETVELSEILEREDVFLVIMLFSSTSTETNIFAIF